MPEKTMRTLSSTATRLQSVATQPSQLVARLQSWWVAYLDWRIEREAAFQLEALSDRELHDIGLRRCEIEGAVKGGLNREHAFSRYH
jgi:uncharacterized protein YjiS (DUF1127 family)